MGVMNILGTTSVWDFARINASMNIHVDKEYFMIV